MPSNDHIKYVTVVARSFMHEKCVYNERSGSIERFHIFDILPPPHQGDALGGEKETV